MRPNGVVVTTPTFNDDLRVGAVSEPLQAQALVTELYIETLAGAVLPWLARVDVSRTELLFGKLFQNGVCSMNVLGQGGDP